jgi:four helix bundle protein
MASVPANIAEGSRRRRPTDFAHFLNVAESSLVETEYHLILSRDLGYLAPETTQALLGEASEISRMLYAFCQKVEQQGERPSPTKTDG